MAVIFATEKEAREFLKKVIGTVEKKETIDQWKEDGIVAESIVEKAEEAYTEYLSEVRNLTKNKDIRAFLDKDKAMIILLYNALQYLKTINEELKTELGL